MARIAAIALCFAGAGEAQAITYTGFHNVNGGLGAVAINITTDNTLGSLADFNIVNYDIQFANFFTFESATLRFTDSFASVTGPGLMASPTALTFDFDSFSRFVVTNGSQFYGMSGAGLGLSLAQCNFNPRCETLFFGGGSAFSTVLDGHDGSFTLATAPMGPPGGVPEPASWALMIAGFGLAGAALRRRKARLNVRYA
jgi:hypothetical protein